MKKLVTITKRQADKLQVESLFKAVIRTTLHQCAEGLILGAFILASLYVLREILILILKG